MNAITTQASPMAELHRLHAELYRVNEILKMAVFADYARREMNPLRPYDASLILDFVSSENERLVQAITEAASRINPDNSEVLHHAG